jgi:hypothetical protein
MYEDEPESYFYGSIHGPFYELNFPVPGGGRTILMDEQDYQEYEKDPRSFIERLMGCSFDLYMEWVKNDGCVPCAATTKKGTPCDVLTGKIQKPLGEYAKLKEEGILCHIHSRSNKRRK